MKKAPLKTYGFRIYIFRNQKNRGLIHEGVIAFLTSAENRKNKNNSIILTRSPL